MHCFKERKAWLDEGGLDEGATEVLTPFPSSLTASVAFAPGNTLGFACGGMILSGLSERCGYRYSVVV